MDKSYLGWNYSQFFRLSDSFGQIISVCWIQPLLGTRRPRQLTFSSKKLSLVFRREKFVAGNQSFSITGGGWKAGDKVDSIDAGPSITDWKTELAGMEWVKYWSIFHSFSVKGLLRWENVKNMVHVLLQFVKHLDHL